MLDAAYGAWRADLDAGRQSVMIAETHEVVTALNTRARLDRITSGQVDAATELELHDGTSASPGDVVVTRLNNRRLAVGSGLVRAGEGWVKNGDLWTVLAVGPDGSLTVQRAGAPYGATVTLPAEYASGEVELGYATTVHRAQGITVDTAHTVVHSSQMTREAFYVAMTRGRSSNIAYVATDMAQLEEHQLPPSAREDEITAMNILHGVLRHVGAEQSAHQTMAAEQRYWSSIEQLTAEYQTLAAVAQREHWTSLLASSGLTGEQCTTVTESEAFGPLTAELRRADANGHDLLRLLPRLIRARGLGDADDVAAVLRHRLTKAVDRLGSKASSRHRWIAGLIPEVTTPVEPDMRQALDERKHLIEQCAIALAEQAIDQRAPWVRGLGPPPADTNTRLEWLQQIQIIAAYRDTYQITDDHPLGQTDPTTTNQRRDAAHARHALDQAQRLSTTDAARHPAGQEPNAPQL